MDDDLKINIDRICTFACSSARTYDIIKNVLFKDNIKEVWIPKILSIPLFYQYISSLKNSSFRKNNDHHRLCSPECEWNHPSNLLVFVKNIILNNYKIDMNNEQCKYILQRKSRHGETLMNYYNFNNFNFNTFQV